MVTSLHRVLRVVRKIIINVVVKNSLHYRTCRPKHKYYKTEILAGTKCWLHSQSTDRGNKLLCQSKRNFNCRVRIRVDWRKSSPIKNAPQWPRPSVYSLDRFSYP